MDSRKEKSLKKTYAKLLKVAFGNGSIDEVPGFVEGDVMGYGTALDEKIMSIKEFIKLLHDQRKQAAKFDDFRYVSNPVIVRISHNGNSALIVDEIELETVIKNESNILPVRMSTLLEYKDESWKIIHWHGSLAEHVSEGEDPWHVNEWKKKTAKLERMVEEKTADLEGKNRDLEIESALERVRSIAMGMRKPGDLLEVCKAISEQLELLQIKDIRNVQVAIINASKKHYLNYQYFTPYSEKVFEVTEYENHPASKGMVTEMKKSANSFFTGQMSGKSLEGFQDWRKTFNQFPDPLLDQSSSVYYYFYSIGEGGLGLTTYREISDSGLEIFKRFHKVFTLAFRRFQDIQKAEAQAREAQIEVALERVRASTMAMHSSDDLSNVASVLFDQMKMLGGDLFAFGIVLCDKQKNMVEQWHSLGEGGMLSPFLVPVDLDYIHQYRYDRWKAGDRLFSIEIPEDYIAKHFDLMFELPSVKSAMDEVAAKGSDVKIPAWEIDYGASFSHGYLLVSSFKPFREDHIFPRFANVFEQAYTRFLDLQKAEEQAREAQIEAALERVRSKAMAMHNSEDLATVVDTFFSELTELNINTHRCGMGIINRETRVVNIQATTTNDENVTEKITAQLTLAGHPVLDQIYETWKMQKEYHPVLRGKEISDYYKAMNPEVEFPAFDSDEVQYGYYFHFKEGGVYAWTDTEIEEKDLQIFRRYTSVLSLTLRRYFDLKEAEAQAREAQIETALERVRSKSIGMQKSEELADLSLELVQQVQNLGVDTWFCAFNIYDDDQEGSLEWGSNGQDTFPKYRTPREGIFLRYYEAGQKGESLLINEIGEDECPAHYDYLCTLPGVGEQLIKMKDAGIPFPTSQIDHVAFFKYGYIIFITFEPAPEAHEIFKRFAKVFEQTYTRFLDLQKAEAQTREALVELALERIRAKVTAMQESADLQDIVVTMRTEFVSLGHEAHYFWYMSYLPETYEKAMTSGDGTRIGMVMTLPRHIHGDIKLVSDWENSNEPVLVFPMDTETAVDYVHKMITLGDFQQLDPKAPTLDDIRALRGLTFIMARTQHGEIGFSLPGYVSDPPREDLDTLVRFAAVFDLAYRRFEDLKSAEKQNRETQIELSLERVRAETMAMRNSQDISDATAIVFNELGRLGIRMERCGVCIFIKDTKFEIWSTPLSPKSRKVSKVVSGTIDFAIHPMLMGSLESWKKRDSYYTYDMKGINKVRKYYQLLEKQVDYQFPPIKNYPERQILNAFYFNEGILFAFTENPLSEEELSIFLRFTKVFSLTFRRYLDLIKAENQAREAVKQASLDRVRGEIASMRSTEDLQRITPLIWKELEILEVPFIRCGAFIIDENKSSVQAHLTTAEGKPIGALHLAFDANELTYNTVEHWKKKKVYTHHWNKEDFINWMKSMISLGQIKTTKQYQGSETPPESLDLHFIPFKQGMLYVGNTSPLLTEKIDIVKTLAEAFSIAYARYEDFITLEEAKTHIEKTLNELKSAQTQLIHAEKMASLGELTAGIAHEIQNPLNFVNNFSEVSADLIQEMYEELKEGDPEEAKAIANDLLQNLEKIHHHGQRASSIVKGMLEHSRSGAGEKILTDINALADEYLRLAYHGLRAKNKSFQADFKLVADPALPKIKIIGQDIGRVFLNLINNAFYACTERLQIAVSDKSKNLHNGYKPTVIVSTKFIEDRAEIRVRDNGNGIPKKVLDKIFQPFFTTKPTGEGTGLGLSLSYDIITKGHGGELQVETKEGEGTEFIINLPTA